MCAGIMNSTPRSSRRRERAVRTAQKLRDYAAALIAALQPLHPPQRPTGHDASSIQAVEIEVEARNDDSNFHAFTVSSWRRCYEMNLIIPFVFQ